MNIFAVSPSAVACAQALDSRRLVKMCLETAQIICTVRGGGPYKPTHTARPVVLWAAQPPHLSWVYTLHTAYCREYSFRFGKTHSTEPKLASCLETDRNLFPEWWAQDPRSFQNSAHNAAEGLDFSSVPDTHEAYRLYLIERWTREFIRASQPRTEYFDGKRIRLRPKYPAPTWGARLSPPGWATNALREFLTSEYSDIPR